jgi:prefoldin subunit 5
MGAGVSVDRSREDAKKIVEKRVAELEKSMGALQDQLGQVLERIRLNRQQLEDVSRKLSSQRRASDVRKAKGGP